MPPAINLYQVSCDLISAGKTWLITDVPHYERILGEVTLVYRSDGRFTVDDQVMQVCGVEMADAISIARNLVEYTATGSFKQRQAAGSVRSTGEATSTTGTE